jgi:hypothetical protein
MSSSLFPTGITYECFESVHKQPFAGHFEAQRNLKKASQLYSWPNIPRDIQTWVNQGDSCQRVKAVCKQPVGQMHSLEVPGRRWESISMDLITDLPTTLWGYDSIWVCVDRLSEMVHHGLLVYFGMEYSVCMASLTTLCLIESHALLQRSGLKYITCWM